MLTSPSPSPSDPSPGGRIWRSRARGCAARSHRRAERPTGPENCHRVHHIDGLMHCRWCGLPQRDGVSTPQASRDCPFVLQADGRRRVAQAIRHGSDRRPPGRSSSLKCVDCTLAWPAMTTPDASSLPGRTECDELANGASSTFAASTIVRISVRSRACFPHCSPQVVPFPSQLAPA